MAAIVRVLMASAVIAGAVCATIRRRREADAVARREADRQAERERTVAEAQARERERTSPYRAAWIDPATRKPHRNDHICNQQCRDLRAAWREAGRPTRPTTSDSGFGDDSGSF